MSIGNGRQCGRAPVLYLENSKTGGLEFNPRRGLFFGGRAVPRASEQKSQTRGAGTSESNKNPPHSCTPSKTTIMTFLSLRVTVRVFHIRVLTSVMFVYLSRSLSRGKPSSYVSRKRSGTGASVGEPKRARPPRGQKSSACTQLASTAIT